MERRPGYNYDDPNSRKRPHNPDPNVPVKFPEIVDDPFLGSLPAYSEPIGMYENSLTLNSCDPVADMRPNFYVGEGNVNIPTLEDVREMRDFCHEHPI